MIQRIKAYFERNTFGVCAWWGEKLGINPSKIRLYFIYFSFATLGSFLLPYFLMAFTLGIRKLFKPKKSGIWES